MSEQLCPNCNQPMLKLANGHYICRNMKCKQNQAKMHPWRIRNYAKLNKEKRDYMKTNYFNKHKYI